jgi:hypothetical protein
MNLKKTVSLLALLLTASVGPFPTSAHADTYDFSYTFASGDAVSGSFDGTTVGNFVDNISNIAVGLDGNPFPGPISLGGNASNVSFDASQSFFDFNAPAGSPDFFLLYGSFNGTSLANAQFQELSGAFTHLFPDDLPIQPANWSLTDVSGSSVPDGGTTVAMLGIAIFGLVVLHRRFIPCGT